MIARTSVELRQDRLERMGRNSWEFERLVRECKKSVKEAEENEKIRQKEKEMIKRNSTINFLEGDLIGEVKKVDNKKNIR